MGRVQDKVALVAGAGGGIGGAGALALGREGAAVVCGDVDRAAAEATAVRIRADGGRAVAVAVDVRDRAAIDDAVETAVREFGGLDIMVDSAGVTTGKNVLDLEPTEWDRVIAINLTGMFHLGQAAARQMVRQGRGGSIINVTSQLSEVAIPERTAYVASKGGGRSLTQGMAIDLAQHKIRVNAIGPGPTRTGLTQQRFAQPEVFEWTVAQIPLGRVGEPDDLAGAVLFLASDDSRWVTGTTIMVDGGYLAR